MSPEWRTTTFSLAGPHWADALVRCLVDDEEVSEVTDRWIYIDFVTVVFVLFCEFFRMASRSVFAWVEVADDGCTGQCGLFFARFVCRLRDIS